MSFKKFYNRNYGTEEVKKEETKVSKEDTKVEDVVVTKDYEGMTKKELDVFAAKEYEIELDRRQSKTKMIEEFETKLATKKEK